MPKPLVEILNKFCENNEIRRLSPGEMRELLEDGEEAAWIAEQAGAANVESRLELESILESIAVHVAPAPCDDGGEDTDGRGDAEPDGHRAPDVVVDQDADELSAMDPAALAASLGQMSGGLPSGVDARQLQKVLSSPRGQLLADFGAFCEERGVDGEGSGEMDEAALRVLHDEWRQTSRPTLEGKKPAEMFDGGTLFPEKVVTLRRVAPKVGRNEACPCGSDKKFKKCCGR
ncbi:MAG: SEC-C metal-binding domain-containing protein [Candidatus Latescibacterota bacterium]|nr:SEC-C metal-binding domain-containing protein [Candidatus Latescibacterota bacterium]